MATFLITKSGKLIQSQDALATLKSYFAIVTNDHKISLTFVKNGKEKQIFFLPDKKKVSVMQEAILVKLSSKYADAVENLAYALNFAKQESKTGKIKDWENGFYPEQRAKVIAMPARDDVDDLSVPDGSSITVKFYFDGKTKNYFRYKSKNDSPIQGVIYLDGMENDSINVTVG